VIDIVKNIGFLIQCKHTEDINKTMGKQPIQEVTAALKAYEAEYKGVKFTPVAITNAAKFSEGARELAASNGVDLIARDELAKMFDKYEVLRV
jgi:HJR/Mrr/RecB family endonuclease